MTDDGSAQQHTDNSPQTGTPWLVRHKVELPAPIEGYVERPGVEKLCALAQRPLTVLHAPGGFGKTVLLARCCRELQERGMAVAWLSLDEEDGPGEVATYLALAFERAGVATFDPPGQRSAAAGDRVPAPAANTRAEYRINLLNRALERHAAPCVLVLDEVGRLRSSEAVAIINALLQRAPRNLHVGMAFRERPNGLEIAMPQLEGRGVTIAAEDLRFSAADVSHYFARKLSRRELASVVANSAGWPLALRVYGNARRFGVADIDRDSGDGETVASWMETRLWRGISAAERDFVLDIALFDRLDPELIDEVTGEPNSRRRIASLGTLAGLVSAAGSRETAMRLHPLIKDYCEQRRFEEDAERFRAIHRGIAWALARRSQAVAALRHAAEAGDPELLGRIVELAGGLRLWLEQGVEMLRAVDGLLIGPVLASHPRVALMRCVMLTASGDIGAAKRVYNAAAAATNDFTRDRAGGDDRALHIDHLIALGVLHMCGCSAHAQPLTAAMHVAERVANGPNSDPLLRGLFSLGMCIAHNERTAFDAAAEWVGRARTELGRGSPYLAHVDFQAGAIAMARGRTHEAHTCYDRALKIARASHLRDAGTVMIGEVLAAELEFERSAGGMSPDGALVSPRLLGECFAWFDIYAANAGVGVELELLRAGPAAALALVEDAAEYARRTERSALARFLAALRVSVLLADDQVEEADRAWRFNRLPEQVAEFVDLRAQSWRVVEALACTRLRLFLARAEFQAARELAAALQALSTERGLVRTRMRALSLSMVLERRAGEPARAREHLIDYLRLFAGADYARPLARERDVALALLEEVADAHAPDAAVGRGAARLRAAIFADVCEGGKAQRTTLTRRELDVLTRLERYRDKEIAWDLNLSYEGVRYRVRSIFAKLGARGRLDAVHRARAQGILPPAEETSAGPDTNSGQLSPPRSAN